jgi:hypothetical protein
MPDPNPPSRFAGKPFSSVPVSPERSAFGPAALLVNIPSAINVTVALAGETAAAVTNNTQNNTSSVVPCGPPSLSIRSDDREGDAARNP